MYIDALLGQQSRNVRKVGIYKGTRAAYTSGAEKCRSQYCASGISWSCSNRLQNARKTL